VKRVMTNEELEKLKQEYFAKGGTVEICEPTEYNQIVQDTSRLKHWGEDGQDTKSKDKKRNVTDAGLTLFKSNPIGINRYDGNEYDS